MRDRVYQIFVRIFLLCLLLGAALLLTGVARLVLSALWVALFECVPAMLVAIWRDPVMLIAFMIVCLFLWSAFPHWFGGGSPDPVRRGRRMTSFDISKVRSHESHQPRAAAKPGSGTVKKHFRRR